MHSMVDARERAQPLGLVVMGRAENLAEILGQKLAKLLGRHSRNRIHLFGSRTQTASKWVFVTFVAKQ